MVVKATIPKGTHLMSTDLLEPKISSGPGQRLVAAVSGVSGALPARLTAAALCLSVAVIHIKDQGGFPGNKQPTYVGFGYYLLEIGAVVAAALLLSKAHRKGWVLALGVALGPLIGYALSRGPGLPLYSDDRGHWMETLGVISVLVEVALLLLSVAAARLPLRSDRRAFATVVASPSLPKPRIHRLTLRSVADHPSKKCVYLGEW